METFYNVCDLVGVLTSQMGPLQRDNFWVILEAILKPVQATSNFDEQKTEVLLVNWRAFHTDQMEEDLARWMGGNHSQQAARTILRHFFCAKRCGYCWGFDRWMGRK